MEFGVDLSHVKEIPVWDSETAVSNARLLVSLAAVGIPLESQVQRFI